MEKKNFESLFWIAFCIVLNITKSCLQKLKKKRVKCEAVIFPNSLQSHSGMPATNSSVLIPKDPVLIKPGKMSLGESSFLSATDSVLRSLGPVARWEEM